MPGLLRSAIWTGVALAEIVKFRKVNHYNLQLQVGRRFFYYAESLALIWKRCYTFVKQ